MLAITRRNVIKDLLKENKSVTITDLAERMNVTRETIRRDLKAMEKDEELIRTHGGAYILEGVQNEIDINTRQVLRIQEKKIIAEKCDALIEPGDIIFLDSSTTDWFIARRIAGRKLTVLTTSLEIAQILQNSSTIHLVLIGGEYSLRTRGVIGGEAVRNIRQHFVDKAFISCRSLSREYGLTDTHDETALLHQATLEHSRENYLAVDHTKLDSVSFINVAPISTLNGVVTDKELSGEWKQCLERNGVSYY